jgi:N-acetylglutamate synthase-like GNAT family acetyltransferase
VDAALLRSLMVIEPMRRRGIGAALVAAARTAAHTRGTRTLYAIALKRLAPAGAPAADASMRVAEFATAGYFERFGFVPETTENLIAALAGTFVVDYLRARPDQLARCEVLSLDISNDGVIVR